MSASTNAQLPETTYLFVPASRADRFEKALSSGADSVIIDLEDAVAPDEKDAARSALVSSLSTGLSAPVIIRINPEESSHFGADLEALGSLSTSAQQGIAGIMVPKCETLATVATVQAAFDGRVPVIALIETASGVANVASLASAAGVTRLALGAADFSVDLDIDPTSPTVDYVYSQLVVASRAADIPGPIGSPYFAINNFQQSEIEARRLRTLGVTAQLCIHPSQVAPVRTGFAPTQAEVEWAQKMIGADGGATTIDGQMVDRPIRERAERILARSAHTAMHE